MSAATAVALLASGCSVRAAAAAAVLSSSLACCPSTFAAVSVMRFAFSVWLRLRLCHQLVACVAMLCIFCAALLAAALICVAKLAAGSGELGCCNGTCASAAISCTASVAMCCCCIGVFAVAPLHSSVYCGAATASAATAFPLLISVISSSAACVIAGGTAPWRFQRGIPFRLFVLARVGRRSPHSQFIKDAYTIIYGEFVACICICHCLCVPLLR